MARRNIHELLGRLAQEEQRFLGREFLAPALRGRKIRVRIAGSVCQMQAEPSDFEGWGVFQPVSFTKAAVLREASLAERRRYLELLPAVKLIVCLRQGDQWRCAAGNQADSRIRLEGLAQVALIEEVQQFDSIVARYDGSRFWFDELDMRREPAAASYLRSALLADVAASALQRPGLTAEERAAYELNQWEAARRAEQAELRRQERQRRTDRRAERAAWRESDAVQSRLRDNLSHAGAELIGYLERSDSFRVSYTVDGERFTSSVDKHDLTVQSAGICLDGTDRNFDLASLVGVLREGRRGNAIYRMD
jgi:hypothetical protein